MEIGPSQFMQLSVLGPILPPSRRGILTARTVRWGYCNDLRNTFLCSPYPKLPFLIHFSLVQTRYLGHMSVPIHPTFRSGPYTASLKTEYFHGLYSEVGLLHRLTEYISGLSIPVVSFWYKYFLGANPVPWSYIRPNLCNFPFWALYCLPRDGVF